VKHSSAQSHSGRRPLRLPLVDVVPLLALAACAPGSEPDPAEVTLDPDACSGAPRTLCSLSNQSSEIVLARVVTCGGFTPRTIGDGASPAAQIELQLQERLRATHGVVAPVWLCGEFDPEPGALVVGPLGPSDDGNQGVAYIAPDVSGEGSVIITSGFLVPRPDSGR
jgi:hypothetical protein